MLKLELLQQLLIVAIALSTITCSIIQKTKKIFKNSKHLCLYSFIINILFCIVFCYTFTEVSFPISLWVGLFSFIGADTLYKSLEGKLSSYNDLSVDKTIKVKIENIIDTRGDK